MSRQIHRVFEIMEPESLSKGTGTNTAILDEMKECEKIFWSKTQVERDWDYRDPDKRRTSKPRDQSFYSEDMPWQQWCAERKPRRKN